MNEINIRDDVIEGHLFVRDDVSWVETAAGERIAVSDPKFIGRLLDTVPCYVGGEFIYNDIVHLVGQVVDVNGQMRITSVKSGILFRKDECDYSL